MKSSSLHWFSEKCNLNCTIFLANKIKMNRTHLTISTSHYKRAFYDKEQLPPFCMAFVIPKNSHACTNLILTYSRQRETYFTFSCDLILLTLEAKFYFKTPSKNWVRFIIFIIQTDTLQTSIDLWNKNNPYNILIFNPYIQSGKERRCFCLVANNGVYWYYKRHFLPRGWRSLNLCAPCDACVGDRNKFYKISLVSM
jgi:hypothetical protein